MFRSCSPFSNDMDSLNSSKECVLNMLLKIFHIKEISKDWCGQIVDIDWFFKQKITVCYILYEIKPFSA